MKLGACTFFLLASMSPLRQLSYFAAPQKFRFAPKAKFVPFLHFLENRFVELVRTGPSTQLKLFHKTRLRLSIPLFNL
jgi:hypothetical protein